MSMELTFRLTDEQLQAIALEVARLLAEQRSAPAGSCPSYLTAAEAAELLRWRRRRIYELVADGRLARHGDGRRLLVARAEVERLARGD